jgi:hypothetical protein
MTDDLAAFVAARLDEDEAVARAATPAPWEFEGDDPTDDELYSTADDSMSTVAWTRDRQVANGQHIARHDPARVLREVEAKRAHLRAWEAIAVNFTTIGESEREFGARVALEAVLEADAAVWSDHADYRAEWKP